MVTELESRQAPDRSKEGSPPAVEARAVWRTFGTRAVLRGVSLVIKPGEIHALLGPNGAGKTTLLRILCGLTDADAGELGLLGLGASELTDRRSRMLFGLVPSGDRTFYLRLSGLENLVFFGRLQGLPKRAAVRRAAECLEAVGLAAAARQMVGTYSHGMQKRLSVARAILMSPPVFFVDEATHDLDPEGASRVRELIRTQASLGTAVVWATQRIDEIRGFADQVTLLDRGEVRFVGTVPQLMRLSAARTYILDLRDKQNRETTLLSRAKAAIAAMGAIDAQGDHDPDHFLLSLSEEAVLGEAVAALTEADIEVRGCREERSDLETAFLRLTMRDPETDDGT